MSTTTIKPTVGRVVWFYPSACLIDDGVAGEVGQPLAAVVTAAHNDELINLAVFDALGKVWPRISVPLVQEGQGSPTDRPYAAWMPYQIGQAKKHADEPKAADTGRGPADSSSLRAHALDMALRTPGLNGFNDVLRAASAYQSHIDGQPAPGSAFPGYGTLQPHQQRVVDERAELDSKLSKLNAFIDSATFNALDADEQNLLKQQAATMAMYSDILTDRITAFAPAGDA